MLAHRIGTDRWRLVGTSRNTAQWIPAAAIALFSCKNLTHDKDHMLLCHCTTVSHYALYCTQLLTSLSRAWYVNQPISLLLHHRREKCSCAGECNLARSLLFSSIQHSHDGFILFVPFEGGSADRPIKAMALESQLADRPFSGHSQCPDLSLFCFFSRPARPDQNNHPLRRRPSADWVTAEFVLCLSLNCPSHTAIVAGRIESGRLP